MKILAVSDVELGLIYSAQIRERFKDADLLISCGDLPYYYLEYMVSMLDKPLYYVRGNHASVIEYGVNGERTYPWGGMDLHLQPYRDTSGLLLAGVEGSLRYREGPYQYSQAEMWFWVFNLVPTFLLNRLLYGRFLDIFVSHAPPWKIHDQDDLPHRGIKAFRWLDAVFKPAYHLHGHIHIYGCDTVRETQFRNTRVINTYGYSELVLPDPSRRPSRRP
jgi:hypothetical protein